MLGVREWGLVILAFCFVWTLDPRPQTVEQRFRLLQILRLKPFREPAVDLRQHAVSFVLLALLLPEAGKAGGGAEFPRLRLLLAGDRNGLVKTRFGFRLRLGAGC